MHRLNADRQLSHFLHGTDKGGCAVGRGGIRDMQVDRRPPDLVAVFGGSFAKGCINDPDDIPILNFVENMRPSLGNFIDLLTVNITLLEEQGRAAGCENSEAEFLECPG